MPAIFGGHDDGLYYVKEVDWPSIVDDGSGPKTEPIYQMSSGTAGVPDDLLESTIEASEECPGECIFIEID